MQSIASKLFFDFFKQRNWIREISPALRSHEMGDQQSVHRTRRISARKVVNDDSLARVSEQIPNRAPLPERSVDGEFAFRMLVSPDEFKDPVLAGILAGHKRRPCDGGDWRKSSFEIPSRSAFDQACDVRKVVLLDQPIEHIERSAIESNDQ